MKTFNVAIFTIFVILIGSNAQSIDDNSMTYKTPYHEVKFSINQKEATEDEFYQFKETLEISDKCVIANSEDPDGNFIGSEELCPAKSKEDGKDYNYALYTGKGYEYLSIEEVK